MSTNYKIDVINKLLDFLVNDFTEYHYHDDMVECEGVDWDELESDVIDISNNIHELITNNIEDLV